MATWKKVLVEGAVAINDLSDASVSSASSAQILVHDGVDSFDNVSVSGDVTIATTGAVTIGADKVVTAKILDSNVTLAKIADIAAATVLGNATASAAAPTALTIDANLSSVSANDDTLASAKAIKSYVDSEIATVTAAGFALDVSGDSGAAQEILNSETLNLAGTANQISTTTGTNSVVFSTPAAFIAPGSIASTSTITAATGLTVTTGGADITGNTTIAGNLTVTGTTTSVQTETLVVEDKNVVLANPDSAYATNDTGAGLANDGANGGGLTLTSHHGSSETMFAALNWSKTGQNLTGWTLRDTADYSTATDVAQTDFEISIMDFNLTSADAPTGDAAGVGSFFFAQSASNADGALYVRVQ